MRNYLSQLRTRWRRWRLLKAYADVFKERTGKDVGFSPLMAAYQSAARDGLLKFEDGDVVWYWPEDGERV